jgi:hypothetical protein
LETWLALDADGSVCSQKIKIYLVCLFFMSESQKSFLPKWIEVALIFILGVVVFIFVLVNRYPFPLRQMAIQARYGLTIFAPIAIIVFFLVFRLKGIWGNLLCFILILSLFALGLSGLWASGMTEPQVISGLLPTVDAGEYYYNGLRFLNGSLFSDFSTRRPIFSAFLSSLLWITNKNLQISIALMVFFAGLCSYLATMSIRDRFGPFVSALFLILLFLFYRRFSGLVMSENIGFSLGLLSFSLLIQGIFDKKSLYLYVSLFLLSYALNARAGPFFILPFLIFGISFYLRGNKNIWRFIIPSSIAVLFGFCFNLILFEILGSPTGTLFSNFSYTLYGLSQGGAGWTRIMVDHPEILALNETELSKRIIEFTFIAIKANPWNFIVGCSKQYIYFLNFIKSNVSVFSFASGDNSFIYNLTQISLYLLSIIGLCHAYINRKRPFFMILLMALLGIFLSVPFLISDTSNMRAFAATIPIIIFFPALGIVEIINRIPVFSKFKPTTSNFPFSQITISITMVLLTILPIFLFLFLKPSVIPQINCPTGQTQITADLINGTYVKIFPESEFFLDWMPNFHESRFKTTYLSYTMDALRNEIKLLPSRAEIMSTINLLDNKELFLVIVDQAMFDQFGRYSICGNWSTFATQVHISQYFYADSFFKVK